MLGAQRFVFSGHFFWATTFFAGGIRFAHRHPTTCLPCWRIGSPRHDSFSPSRDSTGPVTGNTMQERQGDPGHQPGPGSLTGSHNLFLSASIYEGDGVVMGVSPSNRECAGGMPVHCATLV